MCNLSLPIEDPQKYDNLCCKIRVAKTRNKRLFTLTNGVTVRGWGSRSTNVIALIDVPRRWSDINLSASLINLTNRSVQSEDKAVSLSAQFPIGSMRHVAATLAKKRRPESRSISYHGSSIMILEPRRPLSGRNRLTGTEVNTVPGSRTASQYVGV